MSSADVALSWEAGWVQRATGKEITPDLARCIDTLSAIQRPYNWNLIGQGWQDTATWPDVADQDDLADEPPVLNAVVFGKNYMVVRMRGTLSTYDFSELTNLVLAAHKRAVRVEVSAEMYRWVDTESYLSEYSTDKDGNGKWVETDKHPSGPGVCLRVLLSARQREGHRMERHPTIEQVLEAAQ